MSEQITLSEVTFNTLSKKYDIRILDEFISNALSDINVLPKELLSHIYVLSGLNPKILWLYHNFRLWYDVIFTKIKTLLSDHIFENTDEEHPCIFWESNVYVVYFIFIQLQNKNHINFSFSEESSSHKRSVSLQRKYVHIINNIILEFFTDYKVNKTRKVNKETWNEGYESDEYDEVTGTWDWRSAETGPCYNIDTMYYISLYLKDKRKYNKKKVYAISFNEKNIIISRVLQKK